MMKILMMYFFMYLYMYMLNLKILMNFISNMMVFLLLMILFLNIKLDWFEIYSWIIVDYYSITLFFLSVFIIKLMFKLNIEFNKKFYSLMLMILLNFLMLSFVTCNMFMFYLFFEISLIPTFFLIMGWGYQSERIKASMYMLLYTLFSSLPLLLILFYLYMNLNTMNFYFMLNKIMKLNLIMNFFIYFILIFSFLVKLPMFMFHVWLPKAHVEAPVSGSMILAAVMLKLGGYGLYRVMLMMMNLLMYNFYFILMSILGMIYLSLMCLRQFDMKMLVAYSSVVHMSLMILGIFSLKNFGYKGGLMIMVGHGLCSSGLFFLVNLLYERSKSRMMYLNKGMIYFLPSLSMFWFMFCVINMSAPPSINLLSELMIFFVMLNWSIKLLFLLILSIFLSSIYSLYLFSYCQHGKFKSNLIKIYLINMNDYLILLMHLIPLNLMILKTNLLI